MNVMLWNIFGYIEKYAFLHFHYFDIDDIDFLRIFILNALYIIFYSVRYRLMPYTTEHTVCILQLAGASHFCV